MDQTLTQQQQWLLVKRWFKKNGLPIVIGVVIGIGGVIGWKYWQSSVENHRADGATLYILLQQAVAKESFEVAQQLTDELISEYADTPYGNSARLIFAKLLYKSGKKENAVEQLKAVLNNNPNQIVREAAANRLARLYIDLNQIDNALMLISAQLGEILGGNAVSHLYLIEADAFIAQNQFSAARAALNNALKNLPTNSPLKNLIDLKINNFQNR